MGSRLWKKLVGVAPFFLRYGEWVLKSPSSSIWSNPRYYSFRIACITASFECYNLWGSAYSFIQALCGVHIESTSTCFCHCCLFDTMWLLPMCSVTSPLPLCTLLYLKTVMPSSLTSPSMTSGGNYVSVGAMTSRCNWWHMYMGPPSFTLSPIPLS